MTFLFQEEKFDGLKSQIGWTFRENDAALKQNIIPICLAFGGENPLPFQEEAKKMNLDRFHRVTYFMNDFRIRKQCFLHYLSEAVRRQFNDPASPTATDSRCIPTFAKLEQGDRLLLRLANTFKLETIVIVAQSDSLKNNIMAQLCLYLLDAVYHDATSPKRQSKYSEFIEWFRKLILEAEPDIAALPKKRTVTNNSRRSKREKQIMNSNSYKAEILQMKLNEIQKSIPVTPLAYSFEGTNEGHCAYFDQYKAFILEETREAIATQYKLIRQNSSKPFQVEVVGTGEMIKTHGLAEIVVKISGKEMPKLDRQFGKEVFLFQSIKKGKKVKRVEMLGIAEIDFKHQIEESDIDKGTVPEWVYLRASLSLLQFEENKALFSFGSRFDVYLLVGVINYSRMFEACVSRPSPPFMDQVVSASLCEWPSPDHWALARTYGLRNELNEHQFEVISNLFCAEQGMFLLQGPPGTGKTTTLAHLLKALVENDQKIMVCAPANKALRVLAEKCVEVIPNAQDLFAFTGTAAVADMSEKLQSVHTNLYNVFLSNKVEQLSSNLHRLHLQLIDQVWRAERPSESDIDTLTGIIKALLTKLEDVVSICDKLRDGYTYDDISMSMQMQQNTPKYYMSKLHHTLRTVCANATQKADAYEREAVKAMHDLISGQVDRVAWPSLHSKQTYAAAIAASDSLPNRLENLYRTVHQQVEYFLKPLKKEQNSFEALLLNRARVVFCTLVTSGRNIVSQNVGDVDVLIIDEAAQALEPETLIPFMYEPSLCLQVGDTKQLPAVVHSKVAEAKGFGRSMMHRLVDLCGQSHKMLQTQYRMHPDICAWPSKQYYEERLITHQTVLDRPRLALTFRNVRADSPYMRPCNFFHVDGHEMKPDGLLNLSTFNIKEVQAVHQALRDLFSFGVKPEQIGVITFYSAQVEKLKEAVASQAKFKDVQISTVDGFQGEEKDIILVSTVRTSESVGFLNDFRRPNVAVTRARHHLYLFGHASTLQNSNSDFKDLVPVYRKKEWLTDLTARPS